MIADKLAKISERIASVNVKSDALNEKLRDLVKQFTGIRENFHWYDVEISIAYLHGDVLVGFGGEIPDRELLSAPRQLRLRFVENLDRFLDAFSSHIDAELALFDNNQVR